MILINNLNKTFKYLILLIYLFLSSYNVYSQSCNSYTTWYQNTWYNGQILKLNGTNKLYTPVYSSTLAPLDNSSNRCEVSSPCTNYWKLYGTCISCSVSSASSTQTININTELPPITHTTINVTGITSSSGLPTGVTASYASNSITISGKPSISGTFNYIITPTGCATTATGTIIVNMPLPIELSSFTAELKNNLIQLNWITTSEKNNDYYILEKSYNIEKWINLTEVKSIGNINTLSQYIYNDSNYFNGICYYKLTQVDIDGTKNIFNIISIEINNIKKNNEFILYPNPFFNNFTLEYFSDNNNEFIISIETINGQEIYHQKYFINKGNNIINIPLLINTKGLYFIIIEDIFYNKTIKKLIKN